MVLNKTYQCAYYGVQHVTFIDFDSKQLNKNISKFARKTSEFSFKQPKVVLRLPLFFGIQTLYKEQGNRPGIKDRQYPVLF